MKLTRRQEEFIGNLLELSQEVEGLIHYSVLAERLGVSPFTAYDMLCLLEEKGFVTSAYQLPSDKSGPGRAERVFHPTQRARDWGYRLQDETGSQVFNQKDVSQFILDRLPEAETWEKELLEELLARVPPDGKPQVIYCAEVMMVVSLHLRYSSGRRVFWEYIPEILPANSSDYRSRLSLLGGFAFGILAQVKNSDQDQEWTLNLFEHMQDYQNILTALSPEDCRQLADILGATFVSLKEAAPAPRP
jgi:hypothetical protein